MAMDTRTPTTTRSSTIWTIATILAASPVGWTSP
ncbi:Uncharacterised protein [Mycobacteroides abscessus]|nr:Uncharacterised protein [Mycobacteroides abscessus]